MIDTRRTKTPQESPPRPAPIPRPMWRPRLRRAWQVLRWPLLLSFWAIAFLLGYVGFANYYATLGEQRTPLDLIYSTLQLITMEFGGVVRPLNWQLETARFLLPALAATTVATALAVLFREQLDLFKLWLARDHIVICGLGRKGFLLVQNFRERGARVVVIEQDEENDRLVLSRNLGAVVLVGDATDADLLDQVAVDRARYLIAVCGDDGTNAEIAIRAQHVTHSRQRGRLTCFIHIVDSQLCTLLRERQLRVPADAHLRLELFNTFEQGAHLLWQDHPAFDAETLQGPGPPHLLLVGLGQMGEHLLLRAARAWWEARSDDQPMRVVVVDRVAQGRCASLAARCPQLARACELIPLDMEIGSAEFQRADFIGDVDIAYICLDDDALSLHAGLLLQHQTPSPAFPIVVRMAEVAGLATLLQSDSQSAGELSNLRAFGLLDRTCTPDLVLGGTHETQARAVHEEYVRQQEEAGYTPQTSPSMLPWDELPEHFKASNRSQVDHIHAKLSAIRCTVVTLTDWDAASFQFTAEEIKTVARMEHQRWYEDLVSDGWRFAEGPKNLERKTYPDLVAWEDLPELEKEKNRNAVRELPRFLARSGFQIHRLKPGVGQIMA